MEKTELRIGNFIKFGESIQTVTHRDIRNLHESELINKVPFGSYSGIPLTVQWLEKFGFVKNGNHLDYDGYCFIFRGNEVFPWTDLKIRYKLEYVHQFQNIYFWQTGKELTIKD
jgi:hypothetical protein